MSQRYFLDTNIILRVLLEDNQKQLEAAKKIFTGAKEGKSQLILPKFILIEVTHVLRTYYAVTKEEIVSQLLKLVSIPYLMVEDRTLVMEALKLYEKTSLGFVDCLLFLTAKQSNAKVLTFDENLNKLTKT